MAGETILQLPAVSVAQLTDVFPVVQTNVTSQETVQQLVTLLNSVLQLGGVAQVTGLAATLAGYLPLAGGTLTGNLILNANATLPLQAVPYQQFQAIASGITIVLACAAATTANLNATQSGAGIGATLTNAGAQAAFAVDGYSANMGDRILVKNQTLSQHNGIYSVTTVGSNSTNWVLTRTTDYDTTAQIIPGTLILVQNGTANAITSWLETATVATVDTSPIMFAQFTTSPSGYLQAANNLSDVASAATSRTNLGLGSAAVEAASYFLQVANDLSDLASASAALTNLGLGTPTGTGNVVRQTSPTIDSPTLVTPILGAATATSLAFSPTTGGIIGTTAGDNATAGDVGEMISSVIASGSAVSCSNGVARNVTSINLTAGDFDLWGNVNTLDSSSNTTGLNAWINTSSATQPDRSLLSLTNGLTGANGAGVNIPVRRVNITTTTTYYLSCNAMFSGGTTTACGGIYARRVR